MKFNVHAGHGKQDSKSCGAYTSLMKESIENRLVKDELIRLLTLNNDIVYDTTVDYPTSQADCLTKIIKKCNANKVDLDVSIHFNSGRNNLSGDGSIGGVEVLIYNDSARPQAERICKKLEALGFRNRGVKVNKNLSFLAQTYAPALLVEVCFVDDADDTKLYYKLGYKTVAKAIAEGILNKSIGDVSMIKIKINGKYYELEGIFQNGTNYVKVRELEKAGFKIGFEESVATIDTPCPYQK